MTEVSRAGWLDSHKTNCITEQIVKEAKCVPHLSHTHLSLVPRKCTVGGKNSTGVFGTFGTGLEATPLE